MKQVSHDNVLHGITVISKIVRLLDGEGRMGLTVWEGENKLFDDFRVSAIEDTF